MYLSSLNIGGAQVNKSDLIIGVTGHRNLNLNFIADVTSEVRAQLLSIQRESNGARLVITSGLAEGSDRLVAQVGLDLALQLDALLPTSIPEYQRDFQDAASVDEFMNLIHASHQVLNASEIAGYTKEYSDRPEIYVNLMKQICKRCHILIALWDGNTDLSAGGTYDVVRSFLNRSINNNLAHNFTFTGQVLHILVPRIGSSCPVSSTWLR